jgi:hypothetical protein
VQALAPQVRTPAVRAQAPSLMLWRLAVRAQALPLRVRALRVRTSARLSLRPATQPV